MTLPESRTPMIPLIGDKRFKMIRAINAVPQSNARLSLILREILATPDWGSQQNTITAFRKSPDDFLLLLNTIPVELCNSIVIGTMAYDFCQGKLPSYAGNFQGVYAVGIAVYRNNVQTGEFLNIAEIERLADIIETYSKAWDAWNRHKSIRGHDGRRAVVHASRTAGRRRLQTYEF